MDALKLQQTEFVIGQTLRKCKNPCILWSGGKDSMVLLHILKFRLGHSFPVVCFREPWMPWKQKFVNKIIQDWELEVWDWAPSKVELCQGNGRIDVVNSYQITPNSAPFPDYAVLARGTEPPQEGLPFLCGLETFLSRPISTFSFPWDCLFHGHKSVDSDPCSGKIPLKIDARQNPAGAFTSFPLRTWTDDDIFDYINEFHVAFDETRYAPKEKKVLSEKFHNPDYYHTCFACVEKGGPSFVRCPKYNIELNNVSALVPYVEPQADYCSLRETSSKT